MDWCVKWSIVLTLAAAVVGASLNTTIAVCRGEEHCHMFLCLPAPSCPVPPNTQMMVYCVRYPLSHIRVHSDERFLVVTMLVFEVKQMHHSDGRE